MAGRTPTRPVPKPKRTTKRLTVAAVEAASAGHAHGLEGTVTLKPKKDYPVRRRHPWIFSGAIARASNSAPGEVVRVLSADGELLGRGCLSPSSQIRVRMLTFDDAPVNDALIEERVRRAVALRQRVVLTPPGERATAERLTDSARLVFGESDGVPGLIVDVYGDTVVLQCQSALAERFRHAAVRALVDTLQPTCVLERSDADVRTLEGLPPRTAWLRGAAPEGGVVTAHENGLAFLVDVERGHKTGFYLDQRDSRDRLRTLARGRSVLNCFSYTGGFSVAALAGGATHVTSVDTSQSALELGARNVALNAQRFGYGAKVHAAIKGDCFDVMRALDKEGSRFDVVVLDPPKFAPGAAHLDKAVRGYKDLAIRGLRLLTDGGLLLTFSCSGAVDRALFHQILANASLEARRPVQVLAPLGHALDHPVLATFPEGEYLKGFLAVAAG